MEPKKHHICEVFAAMAIAFAVVFLLDAEGLYKWSRGLPQYGSYAKLSKRLESHWGNMDALYLAAPKHHLRTAWMDFQEGHKLLYPKNFAAHKAQQQKRHQCQLAERKLGAKVGTIVTKDKQPKIVKSPRKAPKPKQTSFLRSALASKLKRGKLQRNLTPKVAEPKPVEPVPVLGPKVFLLGDSMMVSLAPMLKKALASVGGSASVDARVSTGLARPDVYDWPEAVRQKAKKSQFDFLVVVLGTNDGQHFYRGGEVIPYGSQLWVKEYRSRLQKMMEGSCKAAAKEVLWLGLPPMRKASFHRKVHRLNTWIQRQARKYPCIRYINLTELYGDEKGRYVAYKSLGQKPIKIRTSDGIHITRQGGEILSRTIVPMMAEGSKSAH